MARAGSSGAGIPAVLLDIHRRNNAETDAQTSAFASHRARVTALALEAAPEGRAGRLCVLGAGNGNDLDFPALAARFDAIALVDVDAAAIQRACARVPDGARAAVTAHAPVDFTGTLKKLPDWRSTAPTPGQLAHLPDRAVEAVSDLGTFDVVLSTCVLSQVVFTCCAALGDRHPALAQVAPLLVLGHLRAMAHLAAPGGRAILVVDTTSNDLYPVEETFGGPDPILPALEASKAFFAGTNPGLLLSMLAQDPPLAAATEAAAVGEPWLWNVGPGRHFLVYALSFRRRS